MFDQHRMWSDECAHSSASILFVLALCGLAVLCTIFDAATTARDNTNNQYASECQQARSGILESVPLVACIHLLAITGDECGTWDWAGGEGMSGHCGRTLRDYALIRDSQGDRIERCRWADGHDRDLSRRNAIRSCRGLSIVGDGHGGRRGVRGRVRENGESGGRGREVLVTR